jgi:ribulose-phosphate 3-epimerase
MIEIIPAILPENIGELRGKAGLVHGLVRTIQIDFCDGFFVPSKTWPYNNKDTQFYTQILNEQEGLPYWEDFNFEFDLMVKNAHKDFENILKLGPSRVVFHLDAESDLVSFFEKLDPIYLTLLDFGIAVTTTDDIKRVEVFLPYISFVQCMGIERVGVQRQDFDERVLQQIRSVKSTYPNLKVSVDGSVNKSTIHALVEAGADRLVIGSALFDEIDIQSALEDFENTITDL